MINACINFHNRLTSAIDINIIWSIDHELRAVVMVTAEIITTRNIINAIGNLFVYALIAQSIFMNFDTETHETLKTVVLLLPYYLFLRKSLRGEREAAGKI